MDKYSGYVLITYVVTFVILIGYLGWVWWRLRQEEREL
ncbi:heme exporter protein CcmD [Deinococcus psychrotolerans]|uniref:Heme exporter protein D n=2 Tax=Deinococcus TaxID=1298 RepID=A0A553UUC1_9DEIO|nr:MULTISPECIES: heme exporter protein CcmD [Deinococcus]AZI43146.1 heme exporter protein CcmD [Deinococcus psychrotolerans]TSA83817.1 heme exporter protein CcmD [Deinococcus detaillensis]